MIEIKSKREIELMREAGKVLAEVHERAGEKVKPGVSTGELNEYAEESSGSTAARRAFFISTISRMPAASLLMMS